VTLDKTKTCSLGPTSNPNTRLRRGSAMMHSDFPRFFKKFISLTFRVGCKKEERIGPKYHHQGFLLGCTSQILFPLVLPHHCRHSLPRQVTKMTTSIQTNFGLVFPRKRNVLLQDPRKVKYLYLSLPAPPS
jgi:hypothetical protein